MAKLCVAGCSFSDYTQVDTVYGEITAQNLGLEYLHKAGGGGSNKRITREIIQAVFDGNLQSGDYVLVQYTQSERTEFASPGMMLTEEGKQYSQRIEAENNGWTSIIHYDYIHDGETKVTRWKPGSYAWQCSGLDQELHQIYEKNSVMQNYDLEIDRNNHLLLSMFLKQHNINFSVLWFDLGIELLNYWKKKGIDLEGEKDVDWRLVWRPGAQWSDEVHYKYRLSPGDNSHLSQEGHLEFGARLADHFSLIYPELKR